MARENSLNNKVENSPEQRQESRGNRAQRLKLRFEAHAQLGSDSNRTVCSKNE